MLFLLIVPFLSNPVLITEQEFETRFKLNQWVWWGNERHLCLSFTVKISGGRRDFKPPPRPLHLLRPQLHGGGRHPAEETDHTVGVTAGETQEEPEDGAAEMSPSGETAGTFQSRHQWLPEVRQTLGENYLILPKKMHDLLKERKPWRDVRERVTDHQDSLQSQTQNDSQVSLCKKRFSKPLVSKPKGNNMNTGMWFWLMEHKSEFIYWIHWDVCIANVRLLWNIVVRFHLISFMFSRCISKGFLICVCLLMFYCSDNNQWKPYTEEQTWSLGGKREIRVALCSQCKCLCEWRVLTHYYSCVCVCVCVRGFEWTSFVFWKSLFMFFL